jgi:hypothetical protein
MLQGCFDFGALRWSIAQAPVPLVAEHFNGSFNALAALQPEPHPRVWYFRHQCPRATVEPQPSTQIFITSPDDVSILSSYYGPTQLSRK